MPTEREKLQKLTDAIDRGHFELLEFEAVAVKSEPGRFAVTMIVERLVAARPNKKPPRQSKVRELIFDDDEDC